jgi:hypothetical protein
MYAAVQTRRNIFHQIDLYKFSAKSFALILQRSNFSKTFYAWLRIKSRTMGRIDSRHFRPLKMP